MFNAVPPPSYLVHGQVARDEELSPDQLLDMAIQRAGFQSVAQTQALPPISDDDDDDADLEIVGFSMVPNDLVPGNPTATIQTSVPSSMVAPLPLTSRVDLPEVPAQEVAHGPVSSGCVRANVTRAGSNGYQRILTCKDCGVVLGRTKVSTQNMATREPSECRRERKDFRGTTGAIWKWRCKDCGMERSGWKQLGEPGRAASVSVSSASSSSAAPSQRGEPVDQVDRVFQMMATTMEIYREMGAVVGPGQLDIMYAKRRQNIFGGLPTSVHTRTTFARLPAAVATSSPPRAMATATPTTSSAPSSSAAVVEGTPVEVWNFSVDDWREARLRIGVHKGKLHRRMYYEEISYTKFLQTKLEQGALKEPSLINYAKYAAHRGQLEALTNMAVDEEFDFTEDGRVAIVDTGCASACYGELRMQNYEKIIGKTIPLDFHRSWRTGVGPGDEGDGPSGVIAIPEMPMEADAEPALSPHAPSSLEYAPTTPATTPVTPLASPADGIDVLMPPLGLDGQADQADVEMNDVNAPVPSGGIHK
eukprot:Skav226889  [mRNA]  locus=scaffold1187:567035:571377:+ [translate_table: standard]